MTKLHLKIAKEFKRGLSVVGLARKYGMKMFKIEEIIRRVLKRMADRKDGGK